MPSRLLGDCRFATVAVPAKSKGCYDVAFDRTVMHSAIQPQRQSCRGAMFFRPPFTPLPRTVPAGCRGFVGRRESF